uniref:Uncharacterized protein n=1 Tax=Lactuca sativa TaxID=4236 RepID=A0A9R1XL29_LACSA|nr:hypothetical protein LSAT_V11C400195710 [Lactuca sativa]
MNNIPHMFHDYIDSIHDVNGDVNYGFRAIAVLLGVSITHTIMFLLTGSMRYTSYCSLVPLRYWLHMPLIGYLIANKFGVIVHCLSHKQCTTRFSLWRGREEFQPH